MVVDLAYRHDLSSRARHENLVSQVHLGARDVALDDRVAEIAGDLDDRAARDAVEDRVALAGGGDHPVAHHVDVLASSLAHVAVVVEQDCLVVVGLDRLNLGEHAVEVLT